MRHDLSADQWNAVETGVLTAPNGISYTRRTTRMKRKDATALVDVGCPVVTYWPGGLPERTRVIWYDGAEARAAWETVRSRLSSDITRAHAGRAIATAGRWESPDGNDLLVLSWHH